MSTTAHQQIDFDALYELLSNARIGSTERMNAFNHIDDVTNALHASNCASARKKFVSQSLERLGELVDHPQSFKAVDDLVYIAGRAGYSIHHSEFNLLRKDVSDLIQKENLPLGYCVYVVCGTTSA